MYDALVVAHVACALIGFGSVALSGVYGAIARRPQTPRSTDETARYFGSPNRAGWLLLAVPFLGAGALAMRPTKGDIGDVWVAGGLAIWAVAAVLLLAVVRPVEGRLRRGVDLASSGRLLMWASVASDVMFVAALGLMVTQPK